MAGEESAAGGNVLRELVAVFGFGVDTKGLQKGETELGSWFGRLKRLAEGVAAVFGLNEIKHFADEQAHLLDRIDDTANALGISTERVQQLQFASRALGDDEEKLLNLMGRMQVTQEAAAQGSEEAAKSFGSLGIHMADLKGLGADEVFFKVADGIKNQTSASKQAAAATQIFGRAGRELLPFLKEGREGFEALVKEYKELGGAYTKEAIDKGAEYQKVTARLDLSFRSLKSTILIQLFPVLGMLISYVTKAVVWFREMSRHSEIVKATLIVLGTAASIFAIKMALAFSPVILVTAALAALALIIDDLIVMFEGGDSAIGEGIDRLFGKDAHVDVVIALQKAWGGVAAAVKVSWEYAVKFFDKLTEYGGNLGDFLARANNTFGAPAREAQKQILINKVVSEQKAKKTTEEARRTITERVEREAFGAAPATPLANAAGTPGYTPPDFSSLAAPPINFAPRVSAAPPANGNVTVTNGDIKIDVHATPGMDEKALAQHTAQHVDKVLKQRNRATAARFQRAGNQ